MSGSIPLWKVVEDMVAQAKSCGDMPKHLTVKDWTMNHPTDPTRVEVTMSDDSVMTLDIKRPLAS